MALRSAAQMLAGSLRDLAPIVVVVAFFQLVVLREPFPNLSEILLGLGAVAVGLALFIRGLEMSLFPIGDSMAEAFARKGSLFWLLAFAFALGVGTTVAEPALIAVADEAARVRASGASAALDAGDRDFALGLRYTVAAAVGLALVLGVMRIIRGWALYKLIIGGYLLVVVLTQFAPREIVGIAYDSGGVTTGTVTVPLVAALGIGLSVAIRGRSPLLDGFGLIAFASLVPIAFVLVFGMIVF